MINIMVMIMMMQKTMNRMSEIWTCKGHNQAGDDGDDDDDDAEIYEQDVGDLNRQGLICCICPVYTFTIVNYVYIM